MTRRIWMVASRDFITTVGSKGFLIGLLIMPILILVIVMLVPRILNSRSPQVQGEVAVMDASGSVLPQLRVSFSPAALTATLASGPRFAPGQPPRGAAPTPMLALVERPVASDAGPAAPRE